MSTPAIDAPSTPAAFEKKKDAGDIWGQRRVTDGQNGSMRREKHLLQKVSVIFRKNGVWHMGRMGCGIWGKWVGEPHLGLLDRIGHLLGVSRDEPPRIDSLQKGRMHAVRYRGNEVWHPVIYGGNGLWHVEKENVSKMHPVSYGKNGAWHVKKNPLENASGDIWKKWGLAYAENGFVSTFLSCLVATSSSLSSTLSSPWGGKGGVG